MGDPFSIAVGALQVAEVGFKLCDTLHSSVRDFKNAEKDVKRVASEVKTASWALKRLGALLQQDEAIKHTKPGAISEASTALNQCSEAFAEVQVILPASGSSSTTSISAATRFKWATRKSKVDALLANLERLKTTLVLVFKVISYAKEIASSPKDSATDQMDMRFQLETLIKSKNEAVRRYEELVKSLNQTRLDEGPTNALGLDPGSQSLDAGLNLMSLPSNHAQATQSSTNVKSQASETNTGDKNSENHNLNKGLTEALADCHRATLGFLECLHVVHIQWRAVQKYNAAEIWDKYRLTVQAMQALRVVQPSMKHPRLYSELMQHAQKLIIEQWKEEHEATKPLFSQRRSQDPASPSESAQIYPQTGEPKTKSGTSRAEEATEREREREREREDQRYQETARRDDFERKLRGPNSYQDVYRDTDRGLGFAFEKGSEPPKPSQPEYRPKRDEATSPSRKFELERRTCRQTSVRNLDADEDYRCRLEQVSRELGRGPAFYRSETPDPDRERRKREREARLREREIRREPRSDFGIAPTFFGDQEPPPVMRGSLEKISSYSSPSAGSTDGDGHGLRRRPSILDRPMQYDEPQAQIIDNSQSERRENRVRIVDAPTEEDRRFNDILKKPTQKFLEHADTGREGEGVAPLKDASKNDISTSLSPSKDEARDHDAKIEHDGDERATGHLSGVAAAFGVEYLLAERASHPERQRREAGRSDDEDPRESSAHHEDPPTINEYEDRDPQPSVSAASREGSWDSDDSYDQDDHFERGIPVRLQDFSWQDDNDDDDSFDADLENANKTSSSRDDELLSQKDAPSAQGDLAVGDSSNSQQEKIVGPPLPPSDMDSQDTEDPVDALLREWTTVEAC
ncbi:hypothetical protein KC318_g4466 [Hortaea werneckii]|nr:hypothetical protein KC334_g11099 [Hortaea werneckii]KAI6977319.1 hypothetical protein KC355_g11271 [Hortaea werneckii]KAI7669725.1 hypothetical protein KC318_g4466 [Hortaea werneckii]